MRITFQPTASGTDRQQQQAEEISLFRRKIDDACKAMVPIQTFLDAMQDVTIHGPEEIGEFMDDVEGALAVLKKLAAVCKRRTP